jgi:hypothetical protein
MKFCTPTVFTVLVFMPVCGVAVAQSANPAANNAYFAVNPTSPTDIVTQINTLTSTCGANCVIHVPAGRFTTQSSVPITLHSGQSLIGEGESLTSISGNVQKMIVWHATGNADFFNPAGTISNMAIHCGAATIECIDTGDLVQAHLETLLVDGAYNGDCISITNQNHWFERSSFINLTVGSPGANSARCNVGIHLRPATGGTNSFGYAYWPSIYQNSTASGVQVDGGNLLYNASYIGIQSNQDDGFALVAGGAVTASFLSITGEGAGGGIHVLKGGSVRGCGSQLSQLHPDVVDGPNDDTHMPLDLTDCGFGSATSISKFLNEGSIHFTPQILHHSSTGEVNAGLFFTDNANRTGGPAIMFSPGGHFSIGTKELYDVIGTYHPVWWMDNVGNTTQGGSIGVGGCVAPPGSTGDNSVTMRICAPNTARSELYSNDSNANSRMWGSYVVRTQSGDSTYSFGVEDETGRMTAVEGCTRSGTTPTGCTFVPPTVFVGGVTGKNLKSGENVVAYSTTPAFSIEAQSNIVTLNGSIGSFSMAAGAPGQPMTLIFCQSARGGATVGAPRNVRGLGIVGTGAGRCSVQMFVFSGVLGAWMATGPMIDNE